MALNVIFDNLKYLFQATSVTIKITLISFILSLLIGVIIGVIRSSKPPKIIDSILLIYIEINRGIPLLILLFFIYYGLPSAGIKINSFTAAILGLSLNRGAYISEIIRTSILSVPIEQNEIAYVLGMNKLQTLVYIIYPQAIRIAIPSLVTSFASLLKDSSLVSILAITELTRSSQIIYTRTLRPVETYFFIGLVYFIMVFTISTIAKILEKNIKNKYSI